MQSEVQDISPENIQRQLKRLQNSPLFSRSRRYAVFLDYVVHKTLEGHQDELKERMVGVEAFGRQPNYDLNDDPVVRVTAGEVRKRLAQYYYEPEHQDELRIELRPGGYIPVFKFAGKEISVEMLEQPADENVDPHLDLVPESVSFTPANPRWKPTRGRIAVGALAIAVMATAAGFWAYLHRPSSTDLFWEPVTESPGPVLISVGSVVAMVNSNAVAPPAFSISGHPLSSDPIAVSDAMALSSIQQVLSARSKSSTLESSTSTSFSDLQKGPIVLISGFNNQWTMRLTDSLRFHFVRISTDEYSIQDRTDPSHRQWIMNTATPFVKMNNDYGIVARFHDPTTEQIVFVAAGIGENGTMAASRMISDEKYLTELKRDGMMPRREQNFEAVIKTQIIDGKPGPPRVEAAYSW